MALVKPSRLATLAIALVAFLSPDSLLATLTEAGIALKEEYAFVTIGMALASMAYGEKKKEMLKQIEMAERASVGHVVLTHHLPEAVPDVEPGSYGGQISVGADLETFIV